MAVDDQCLKRFDTMEEFNGHMSDHGIQNFGQWTFMPAEEIE